jgi:hypothetical protein
MGGWSVVQSPILNTTITLKRLMLRGYISTLDIYKCISPQLNEPLYTWLCRSGRRDPYPESFREWCERRTSSVDFGGAAYSTGISFLFTLFSHWIII